MRISVRRPSPALVISCIALVFALAGTGYATVLQVPRNSVGTAQLKNSAVTSAKVFMYDLAALDSMARVGSLIGFGVLLLCGAFAYQRVRANALQLGR